MMLAAPPTWYETEEKPERATKYIRKTEKAVMQYRVLHPRGSRSTPTSRSQTTAPRKQPYVSVDTPLNDQLLEFRGHLRIIDGDKIVITVANNYALDDVTTDEQKAELQRLGGSVGTAKRSLKNAKARRSASKSDHARKHGNHGNHGNHKSSAARVSQRQGDASARRGIAAKRRALGEYKKSLEAMLKASPHELHFSNPDDLPIDVEIGRRIKVIATVTGVMWDNNAAVPSLTINGRIVEMLD